MLKHRAIRQKDGNTFGEVKRGRPPVLRSAVFRVDRIARLARWPLAFVAAAALAGCLGPADLDSAGDPLVVTVADAPRGPADLEPERALAVADMRASAVAAADLPYPDVFQREQTLRLAAREEPLPVADAEAIEAELAFIARAEKRAITAADLAALKAGEAELRRLLAAAQAGALR
jgi:hypothetical protein